MKEDIFFSRSEFSQKRFLKQHSKSLSQKPHLKTEALLLACRLLATQGGIKVKGSGVKGEESVGELILWARLVPGGSRLCLLLPFLWLVRTLSLASTSRTERISQSSCESVVQCYLSLTSRNCTGSYGPESP